jgi:hypothetical protein
MIVWVVSYADYDDNAIVGIFSSLEAAREVEEKYQKTHDAYYKALMGDNWPISGSYHVFEWEIDKPEPDDNEGRAEGLKARGHIPGKY